MGKYVYLFELDSVRTTDEEILKGQRALYEEIVGNGNTVVLTYNQLVDSRAFFSLLENKEYYNNLIQLFENGSIKLSQYGDTRSISQYLINALSKERDFIFSGWPLKSTQKRLLALMRRCLTYSDLSEIMDFIEGNREESELLDLFTEVTIKQVEDEETGKVSKIALIEKTTLSTEKCKEILNNLYYLLKTVLRLSFMDTIYVTPKKENVSDKPKDFPFFLAKVLSLNAQDDFKDLALWEEAKNILNHISKHNDRSDYHHDLKKMYANAENKEVKKPSYEFAEAIVDLSYNYQLEFSIRNTSKHYDVSELDETETDKMPSFSKDVFSRLADTWGLETKNRYLLNETSDFKKYIMPEKKKLFPDFSMAVRLTDYYLEAKRKTKNVIPDKIRRYEYENDKQIKEHKRIINKTIAKKIALFVLPCFGIACCLELFIQFLQDLTDVKISVMAPQFYVYYDRLKFILETLLFLFLTEFVTWGLSKIVSYFGKKKGKDIQLLSLSEAVVTYKELFVDHRHTRKHRVVTHINAFKADSTEIYNEGNRIEFINTNSLKKYISLQKEKPDKFLNIYEKMNIEIINDNSSKNEVIKEILRLEELFGYNFGVVYQSKYNTMVVDPLINDDRENDNTKPYYPYERVLPTGKNGTVIVTVHNGKLVLLDQFRHAPRKFQYSFPRGYNELSLKSEENAKNELVEEIRATSDPKPVFIGRISPDSGLSATCADVYLAEVDDYKNTHKEGIKEVIEVSESDFEQMIIDKNNKDQHTFDDGFTLAAYSLYKNYKSRAK